MDLEHVSDIFLPLSFFSELRAKLGLKPLNIGQETEGAPFLYVRLTFS